MLKSPKL